MLDKHTEPFITYDEIKKLYNLIQHKEVVYIVKKLIEENRLKPIKTSKPTALHEQIYTKYRIIKEVSEEEKALLDELNYKIHPKLNIEYYRKNLEKYITDRSTILQLNNYLMTKQNSLSKKVSINERSYEIFNNEKLITSKEGGSILSNLKINIDEDFNIYKTPEPFVYLSTARVPPQDILIIENKDTYITLSKMLLNNKRILREDIHTIIYGCGRKINNSFKGIADDTTLEYLTSSENTFHYWGDIDKAGFNIFSSFHGVYTFLQKSFNLKDVVLFEAAYKMMVEKCRNKKLRDIPTDQNFEYEKGLSFIQDSSLRNEISLILSHNKYIPQEALTMYDLEV
jgi:hypothetical protein